MFEFNIGLFVDGSEHFSGDFVLFLDQGVVLEFHSVKFLFELLNFRLPNIWIKSLLHFTFELVLSLPQQNLSFTLNNFIHEFSLFFSDLINVNFKFDGLSFHFLKLFNELRLKVDIFVLKF
jgi:hypothetical protein